MKPTKAIFVAVPLAILLLPLGIYVGDRATSTSDIARNVTIEGVAVGGLNRADATLAVEAYENRLRSNSGVFLIRDEPYKLSPLTISLDADVETAVDAAFLARRDGGAVSNFQSWLSSFSTPTNVALDISFNDEAIHDVIDAWEVDAIANPAYNGSVSVVDGVVTPEYPRAGQSLDHDIVHDQVVTEMSRIDKQGVVLDIIDSSPTLTDENVDTAAAEMSQMINSSISMVSAAAGFRTTFTAEELATAVVSIPGSDGASLEIVFDETPVLLILEPKRAVYEVQPVDARFDINLETDEFVVVPGRNGTLLDVPRLLTEMKRAALGTKTGEFPLVVGEQPSFTTAEAEAFTSLGPLAGFTTGHAAHQSRVTNIHLMADAVNGSIVLPGEEWSINDHVGERTEEKGYVAAPAIINGSPYCCDHPANIGGGVSQFGTTFYNAVFYSCLEDVDHKAHSLYFPRYPEGREATLGFLAPDVRFLNNTAFPVVIATAYTDTTVTVKMYGDNGGRVCTDDTHERENIVEFTEELVADTEGELSPGEREKIRSGINGFLIKVDRIVTYLDGRVETDLNLVHRYRMLTEQYKVHPCEVSGNPVNCPVRLQSVVGMSWQDALASLSDVGLFAAKNLQSVDSSSEHDIVLSQSPAAGELIDPGTTILLTVGVYSG